MLGGIGRVVFPADDTVSEICETVRANAEEMAGHKFEEFKPVNYKTQLVNGTNYFIKVQVHGEEHIHVRAHKSLQGEIKLAALQEGKVLNDEIKHFQ